MAFAIQYNVPAFDALRYTKKLTAVGVPKQQAEVQAETMRELIDKQLATKVDLKMLEERLAVRFTLLEKDIKHTNQHIELSEKSTNERFDSLTERIELSEKSTNEQIKSLGERTNEQINSLIARIELSEERTNERINAISGKLLIKLGSLIVGSFAVFGVVIPLVIKLA